jgi:hypothetical protein
MQYKKGTFVIVPNKDALEGELPSVQAVFMWVCHFSDDEGVCFPSVGTLARKAGCSVRTVHEAINRLIEIGILEKRERKNGKRNLSNIYQICIVVQPLQGGGATIAGGVVQPLPSNYTHIELNPLTLAARAAKSEIGDSEVDLSYEDLEGKEGRESKQLNKDVLEVFKAFNGINPAWVTWRNNTTQRRAAKALLGKYSLDLIKRAVRDTQEISDDEFAPKVFSPNQLLNKIPNLKDYEKRRNK